MERSETRVATTEKATASAKALTGWSGKVFQDKINIVYGKILKLLIAKLWDCEEKDNFGKRNYLFLRKVLTIKNVLDIVLDVKNKICACSSAGRAIPF